MDGDVPKQGMERSNSLFYSREDRRLFRKAAAKFNIKPQSGIDYLIKAGKIENSPVEVRHVLS